MVAYHDDEWGVPEHGDRRLFELLTLEGAQAGLSWSTILHKREGYRRAFMGFDPGRVASFSARDLTRLLSDAGIVRAFAWFFPDLAPALLAGADRAVEAMLEGAVA